MLVLGLVFMVAGLAFKLGAAPFHMWAPDVYQGAPTAVTLLLGAAPKLAAFAICMRLLVEGLGALAADWQQMLVVMSVASLVIGNITALAQTNIKRMLAYSTISQMGFMLLGLASGVFTGSTAEATASAYSASMFYTITYVLTTLGSFATIMLLSRQGFEAEQLDDFKGLNQRSPWFAAYMMLLMLSLAGVPPLVGFYSKLSVLQAAFEAGQVALVIFDASQILTEQDIRIVSMADEAGKALVVVMNKWDLVDEERQLVLDKEIERQLERYPWAQRVNLSAKTGWHRDRLAPALRTALTNWEKRIPTAKLNAFLGELVGANPPPVRSGKQPKIKFATQAGTCPPKFVVFATGFLETAYRRFIERRLREEFGFDGTPIEVAVKLKDRDND